MKAENCGSKKSIVDKLNFGKKTAKRVSWESWEFTIVGPHQVRVTNASYGYLKGDHAYVVGVEERNGRPVPAECECPADMYREEYDCKHKVALASIGGQTVLDAAVAYETPTTEANPGNAETVNTAADKLKTDGGVPVETSKTVECDCALGEQFPCWSCFQQKEVGQ